MTGNGDPLARQSQNHQLNTHTDTHSTNIIVVEWKIKISFSTLLLFLVFFSHWQHFFLLFFFVRRLFLFVCSFAYLIRAKLPILWFYCSSSFHMNVCPCPCLCLSVCFVAYYTLDALLLARGWGLNGRRLCCHCATNN